MVDQSSTPDSACLLQELLGYLNFSSGTSDPRFLSDLNRLYRTIEGSDGERDDAWRTVAARLRARLDELEACVPAFRDAAQARAVLNLACDHVVPRYRQHHRDLLFHQTDAALWRPFMLGRVLEAILREGPPWQEHERIVAATIRRLNDFIGHRPVAVLRTAQRVEPYPNEWIRPIPLYVRGAGIGVGRYERLLEQALAILNATDPQLLFDASFDLNLLDELALDPRAYDFDHPVNKRPNYHFGQWDPHHLDQQGRYRRFVVQQVTLDALLDRVEHSRDLPPDELLFEAAAVLCGTMLMASGTSGNSPEAFDSSTTLATLLPRIARYRDEFYTRLIERVPAPHGDRLRAEAVTGRQPLAGARQHLNHDLARRRASQLEHVHVAVLFARMGYPSAALRQAHVVPVVSARVLCEMQCRLTAAHLEIDAAGLEAAAKLLAEIEEFLERGLACGALVDPWNILGFQGQFSLFPAPENSVPDHRVDQLIAIVEQLLGLYARLWSEAAARDQPQLQQSLAGGMERRARWWDKFASTTVADIESFSGIEAYASAEGVARTLQARHRDGLSTGDIAFWRRHVEHLASPKAYSLVVKTLLDQNDVVAAMALLMQWLSQAATMPLVQGDYSFHDLARRWLDEVCRADDRARSEAESPGDIQERINLVRKFFDYLEANAEDYWQVPKLEMESARGRGTDGPAGSDDDEDENLYRAAYDEMVYVDSTADGIDAEMLEAGGPVTDYELEAEARRLHERLLFLRSMAGLWKSAALAAGSALPEEVRKRWSEQAEANHRQLLELLTQVASRPIPQPSAMRDSLLEYDRRRNIKFALAQRVIDAAVESIEAARCTRPAAEASDRPAEPLDAVYRAVLAGDVAAVRQLWPELVADLRGRPLLYVSMEKGGDPQRVVAVRALQQSLRGLLEWLPRLGLLRETCQLIALARTMESAHPAGPGAVSEFDRLFKIGFESLVDTLATISADWNSRRDRTAHSESADAALVDCVEQLTQSLLQQWLAHSRTLRLSALEKVSDEQTWQELVKFIERYGRDLFTQGFMNLGNLRAILHQGVDRWLAQLESSERDEAAQLVAELDQQIPRADVVRLLTPVIEAIVENYAEYRDYNTTTTQSDRGDLLYTLLDFLRLRVQYDRVAWHLRPVVSAHDILVRRGRSEAADAWRRGLAERTREVADTLEQRCVALQKKYGMRLPSVSDRLAERFLRPLEIDRMRALVRPATEAVQRLHAPATAADCAAFEILERSVDDMTQEPTGVGLEVPSWLAALEQEVEQAWRSIGRGGALPQRGAPLPQQLLTPEEVERELGSWEE